MTEGGRLPGGKIKGDKPMTGAERIKNFREKEKAMSEVAKTIDTRHEGQVVWLDCGSYARSNWHKLRITKVYKRYVACDDGVLYNLAPGMKFGDRRAAESGKWSKTSSITTIDKSAEHAEQRAEISRRRSAEYVKENLSGLTADQLDRIIAIMKEGETQGAD